MNEQPPADRPGHLDIDAVSAFVDRDLEPDDLAALAIHLHACPACHREVLEIRTTVVLLASLPQYTPRRSFCLGHEHARAARRRGRGFADPSWSGVGAPPPFPATAAPGGARRGTVWLPGLQVAATIVGVMLLLVTSSDLMGMPPQPADWLAGSDFPAGQVEFLTAPAPEAAPPAAPTVSQAPALPAYNAESDAMPAPEAAAPSSAFQSAPGESEGTASDESASQEVLTGEEAARVAPSVATSAALAAVTQAVPTAATGLSGSAEPAADGADPPAGAAIAPSRLRLVQIALAFALAWLLVSIVGLRWVRGLR